MCAGLHDHKFSLGDGLEFVRRHEWPLHHLQGLVIAVLALADGTREDSPAPQRRGKRLRRFALGGETTEDGILAVIANDFGSLFPVVLFKLRQRLDDRHQRQSAGAPCAEQGQDIKGRHSPQFVTVEDDTVLESAAVFIRHGKELTGEVLDHQSGNEVLGGIFFRQDEKDGAFFGCEHLGIDGAVVADDLLQLRVEESIQTGQHRGHD